MPKTLCESCITRGSPKPNPGPTPCLECQIRAQPPAAPFEPDLPPSQTEVKRIGRVKG